MLDAHSKARSAARAIGSSNDWLAAPLTREQRCLVTQVLAAVGLAEADNARGLHPPGLYRATSSHAKADRNVVHGADNNALVLGAVLRVPADVGLEDVAAVQEGHDTVGTHPDLVAGVRSQDGQGGDVQSEFAGFCELACT